MNKMKTLLVGLVAALALSISQNAHAANNAWTVQKVVKSGVSTTNYSSGLVATDTQTFTNNGRTFLHIVKTGANNCTLTVLSQATSQGLAIANQTVTIPATTGDVFVGPFPPSIFNDASQNVNFTFSEESGLSFAVLSL